MATPTRKRGRTDDSNDAPTKVAKFRACSECKKHKIKCERMPGKEECVRCSRQGFKCVINNQLQKIIEDDTAWKNEATAKIKQLENAITDILQHNELPHFASYGAPRLSDEVVSPTSVNHVELPTAMTRDNSQELDTEPELVSAPMRSLYEVTKLRNIRSNLKGDAHHRADAIDDPISTGRISLEEAENLFQFFTRTMNHYLWGGVILVHPNLSAVRRSSSLLLAAILTVASLHIPDRSETFDICYTEFITLAASSTFNRYHTLDEIRGLCIGAFWLSDLSWKLSGHAMRIATEMNLHHSLQRMLAGKPDQFQRAQLWFLLYVCDHHFSIAYGRPPVIHESSSIRNFEAFLQHPSAGPGDVRLICQVDLFITLTRVYHHFGTEVETPLDETEFFQLRTFNIAIEQWRLKWEPRSTDSPFVASYPSKGVVLHYHFAKFQLNSLALRALPANTPLLGDRKEAANIAICSATATLDMVLHEPAIRDAIVGVPLFTHTMVAFAAVFLLKVAWMWDSSLLNIDPRQLQDLVQSVVNVMSSVAASEKHLAYYIANGLGKMLDRFKNKRTFLMSGEASRAVDGRSLVAPAQEDLMLDSLDVYGFDFNDLYNFGTTSFDMMPALSTGLEGHRM